MALSDEMAYGLAQLIDVQGGTIIYTHVTTIGNNANPAPNPPTIFGDIAQSAPASSGDSAISVSAEILTGRLVSGDMFTIAGDPTDYTVNAEVISPLTGPTLTDIPFTPVLAMSQSAGALVDFSYAATFTILALITDFPAYLINGTSIQLKDHKVRLLASSLPGGVTPTIGDLVTLPSGETQKVMRSTHMEIQGVHYGWALQVRA